MTTPQQKEICKNYQKGKIKDIDFNTLFQTYWNEYVAIHGYNKLQQEGEKETYLNFCKYVLEGKI